MDQIIQFINISKRYPGFALEGVSVEIASGFIVGLVGQNGAGKSTFIKSCLGLVRRDAGTILIDGRPLADAIEVRAKLGYIPESLTFYEWMTVKRYLDFIAAFYPSWDATYRINLMERLQLESDKLIKHLSKGMRAKVALIAALCPRPDVLFLDEPTSGMDPLMKLEFIEELKNLVRRGEVRGVIFSSHILGEIADLCNYVAILKEGRLLHFASMEETMRVGATSYPDDPVLSALVRQGSTLKSAPRLDAVLLEKV